jgi:hypothetical protein
VVGCSANGSGAGSTSREEGCGFRLRVGSRGDFKVSTVELGPLVTPLPEIYFNARFHRSTYCIPSVRCMGHTGDTHRDVLIALSFSKVISAVFPFLLTETSFPQNEKKSCSLVSVVSGARPETWMVYPDAGADIVVAVGVG